MERAGVPYLSKAELMAQKLPEEALIDGQLTYRDTTHLSWFGSKVFGQRLARGLAEHGYGALLPPRRCSRRGPMATTCAAERATLCSRVLLCRFRST